MPGSNGSSRHVSSPIAGSAPSARSSARTDSTLVEFTLAAEGDQTRLRVVESGFPQLSWSEDRKEWYAAENTRGWQLELDELREYVSKHVQR